MFNDIKKKYTVGLIVKGLAMLIAGLAILTYMAWDYLPTGPVQELDAEGLTEVYPGKAQMTVYHAEGCFSYFTDDYGKTVSMDFLVPVGVSDLWMGARLDGRRMDDINANMELFWNTSEQTDGNIDWDGLYEQYYVYALMGHVEKMDTETEDFYREYLDYFEMTDEELEQFIPYIFVPAKYGQELSGIYAVLGTVMALCFIGFGIYNFIDAFVAFYLKGIKKYIEESGSPDAQLSRLEAFYSTVPDIDNFKINDDYFMYLGKGGFRFAESKDVLWLYQHVLTTNYVAKSYTLKVCFADGKVLDVPTTKKGFEPLVESLNRRLPDVVVGYSDELKNMFGKNREAFVAEIARRRQERMGNIE